MQFDFEYDFRKHFFFLKQITSVLKITFNNHTIRYYLPREFPERNRFHYK